MTWRIALVLLLLPLLLAVKCIASDRRLLPPDASAGSGDGAGIDGVRVTPAVACPDPDRAMFIIESEAFNIQCGCAESTGKTCTINAGTTVVWQFADSEAHNVTSIANAFGMSSTVMVGNYSHTFDQPGTFGYGCSIHSDVMSGYSIVVR
jgi:hypothetical protein